MKVSIITSCYNREATIAQAIESVIRQDYPCIEHIVVDGASNDRSLEIINSYRDRIAKIISEPDSGMYEGINKGIRAATGDIIGLLHSDDFLFDTHIITKIVEKFESTDADIVYGNGLFVDPIQTDKTIRDWRSGGYRRWKVRTGWLPLHPTVYIRREPISLYGLYDESYKIASDSDFLVRYLWEKRLRVEYLDRYVVRMRMGGLSTGRDRRKQMWREDVRMYNSHGFSGIPEKLMKIAWKVPQFIRAKIKTGRSTDSNIEQLFFWFIRKGLWNGDEKMPVITPPSINDWQELSRMAYSQAVTGLFFDGVACTPVRPGNRMWQQWILHLLNMEQSNAHNTLQGKWWIEKLSGAGISATIFKGTSVAGWYRSPLHRSHGDLDIVITGGWKRLMPFLQELGITPYSHNNQEVVVLDKGGLFVEFHRQWEQLYNPMTNARLQRLCSNSSGCNNELYFVCLVLHLQRHFLAYGTGLKQVCDVAAMLHSANIDRKMTARMLSSLHTAKFSRLLFGFIDTYIGGTYDYPLPPISNGKKFVMMKKIIFNDGYLQKMQREDIADHQRHSFQRVASNAWFWLKRSVSLSGIMPGETFWFLLRKAWQRIAHMPSSNL